MATKPSFKYATTTEKNKLFVKNLPFSYCTKEKLAEVFDKHGKLKDVRVVTHKDGRPKGLAYIEYEDEKSAAAAIEHTNGMLLGERKLDVAISAPPPRKDPAQAGASLGAPKREATGGMRRTQLSSLIPSVLQKAAASTSQAPASSATPAAANGSTNGEKRPMSNADFRSMLLKK
ncbi:RNA recognition motif domain-containing protein [Phthorimaea operculella]|nr:RNA recognition motif domain-containing protein [Phthorimaea operculella]